MVQSITGIAENAMLADGWSTAFFILRAQQTPVLNNMNIRSIIVDNKGILTEANF